MGQKGSAASGRSIFLAFGDVAALGPTLAQAGWCARNGGTNEGDRSAATIVVDGPTIAFADLRGFGALPDGWAALSTTIARCRAALVVLGEPAVLHAALEAGATHVVVDASPESLALTLASAAIHVERLSQSAGARDPIGDGVRGWDGPATALARVEAALAGLEAGHEGLVLLVVLERFEIVNAAWGRAAGDQILEAATVRIARAAEESFGATARVERVAGSEFLIVAAGLAGSTPANGPLAAERIAARLTAPFVAGGVPVSIGHRVFASARRPGETAAALLGRLREAVAAARVDEPVAGDDAPDTLAIDLHHAMEREQVELLFQPQVSLTDARIVGVEALARWAHPRLGTLGAEQLLAAAARAGLAGALSAHIQSLALRVAAAWTGRLATLRLAINVTAQDVAAPGFPDRVLARLADSGFPAERLTLEVTETGLILDLETAAAAFAALREAGCRVALDDFGTGYSSLAYLKALPVDTLKIDKAITRDATGSARDRAVLEGVVGIARALGMTTVVEGVETTAQRDRLAALGCDLYQGYLCAEPIGAEALARLVEDRR